MTLIGGLAANPALDAGFRVGVATGRSKPSLRSSAPGSLETFRKSGRGAAAGAACLPDLILLGRAGLKGRGRTSQAELWPEVVADARPELDHTLSHDLLEPCRAAIDGVFCSGRRH